MRRSFLVGGLVAVLLAASAGVAAWQLGRQEEKAEAPSRERAPDKKVRAAAARGGDVEQRIQRLERKVAMLERQRAMARVLAGGEEGDEAQGPAAPGSVDDPVFEMAVRDVVERVGSERAEENRAQRRQRMERWSQRWTDETASAIGLNAAQKAKVQQIVRENFETMLRAREAGESGDAGASAGGLRERRRQMRETLDKRLAEVLSPAQMQKLEALRESGELTGPYGRGGRGRRD